jgi:RNA polymerase sigma-70 factor (ECF subfamily)
LDRFLASVERRAVRIAQISTGNKDDALDIVQDTMFKLAEKYADKPEPEWGPLFNRILHSKINDFHRRNYVRKRYRGWLGLGEDENEVDAIQTAKDEGARSPEQLLSSERRVDKLEVALQALSSRQKQAFLLRVWEGLDVKDTAKAMSCSEGSVKTHLSRAIHSLRESLGEHWL